MSGLPFDFERCERAPFGWYCRRQAGHHSTCDAKARWWNIVAHVRDLMNGF